MLTEQIKGLIEKFSVDFLRSTIMFYLQDILPDRLVETNKFHLSILEEHGFSEDRQIFFSVADKLTVLDFYVRYNLFSGFWYKVEVGVGEITERKVREPYVEKFKFMVKFNDNFSLYDCEYYYTKGVPPTSHHVK